MTAYRCALALMVTALLTSVAFGQDAKAAVGAANARFEKDFRDGNRADLEQLLTPDFVWIHGTGSLMTREQLLGPMHGPRYVSIDDDEVKISVYNDAAVLTERSKRQYTKESVPFLSRFTIVFVKHDAAWHVASMHSSQLQPNGQPLPLDRVMPPGSTHSPSTPGKKN